MSTHRNCKTNLSSEKVIQITPQPCKLPDHILAKSFVGCNILSASYEDYSTPELLSEKNHCIMFHMAGFFFLCILVDKEGHGLNSFCYYTYFFSALNLSNLNII